MWSQCCSCVSVSVCPCVYPPYQILKGSTKLNETWYEAYPQNEFRLQILPLQCCCHDRAHTCRVCWSFGTARTRFAGNQTAFTHRPVCLECWRKSRSPPHVKCAICNPFLECKKHETGWHSSWTLWGVWRTCLEWFNGTEMGETL
jgi:hypothetical protein